MEEHHIPFQEKQMLTYGKALWQGGCNGELMDWFLSSNKKPLEIRKNS